MFCGKAKSQRVKAWLFLCASSVYNPLISYPVNTTSDYRKNPNCYAGMVCPRFAIRPFLNIKMAKIEHILILGAFFDLAGNFAKKAQSLRSQF